MRLRAILGRRRRRGVEGREEGRVLEEGTGERDRGGSALGGRIAWVRDQRSEKRGRTRGRGRERKCGG
eukprot:7066129-Pyramimonas_sp.AAC.1